jgi:hypothetical protein
MKEKMWLDKGTNSNVVWVNPDANAIAIRLPRLRAFVAQLCEVNR